MPRLSELCQKYFETNNLYEVLNITKKASEKDVKKAYHKLSLEVHPDRVNEDDKLEATEKFKVLGAVHSILSDPDKRAIYDETGTVDNDEDEIVQKDWTKYWRIIFRKVTMEDIVNYEKQYIGSKEELLDLKKAYLAGKGDMDYIVDHVQFACSEQEPRLRDLIYGMIEKDEVPSYKIFTNEPEKKRKRRHAKENREAVEAEKNQKEFEKENGTNDLALVIKQKQQARGEALDSFIDGLAAKYGGTASTSKPKSNKRKATQKTESTKKRKTRK